MIIKNALVYTEDGCFVKQDIYIKDGWFVSEDEVVRDKFVADIVAMDKAMTGNTAADKVAIGKAVDDGTAEDKELEENEVLDAEGCYAIPGLTDIHFHGCAGYDFCDGTQEAIGEIAKYEASVGVTSIVPATMTLDERVLMRICEAAADYVKKADQLKENETWNEKTQSVRIGKQSADIAGTFWEGKKADRAAELCGIYLEGPFIAESKKGAQNGAYIRKPDWRLYEKLNHASGQLVRLVALAPELEGAMEFIEANSKEKAGESNGRKAAIVSLAHTAADYETARKAFEKGAAHVTHLYNAMNPYTHRAPGILAAAAEAGAEIELICDGVHVHPAAVRMTFQIFGDNKIIFVSDSMMATGLEDGMYQLGGQKVTVTGNRAMLEDGTIAGSVTHLLDCMRIAVLEMGIPLESAVKCAAVNPAKCVGIYDRYGSISPGKVANVVLLRRKELELQNVILGGKLLERKKENR